MSTLKKLTQMMLICGGVAVLSACSYLHHHNSGANGEGEGDASSAAQSSGVGAEGYTEGSDGSASQSLVANRTYYFDFDKNTVHDADKPAIYANADYLLAHPHAHIILAGHTDPRGSREYNVALGERRANAVLDLLKSKGVKANQIRVVSYGQEKLASPGHTEQDYQLDRRAVIVLAKNE